jgi:hypothetical protein
MAKNTEKKENLDNKENQTIKAKALVFLKYDKDVHKIGDEFSIRIEDAEKMVGKGYIEALEEIAAQKDGE